MANEYEFMDTQDLSENGPNTSEDLFMQRKIMSLMMPMMPALRGMFVP